MAAGVSMAGASVGQPAPGFSAVDTAGNTVSLADFRGRHVVLEWVNPSCPFVQKHYVSASMQATQKAAVAQGVVWLTINSTASDAADYKAPASMATRMRQNKASATATLMDADGAVGRAYGARTTPHMYVIDPAGRLIYAGAIDSRASSNPEHVKTSTNYVQQALGEALAGKPVSLPTTTAYGCSIKYASGA